MKSGVVTTTEITADKKLKFEFVAFDPIKAHKLWLDIKEAQNSLHRLRENLVTIINWSTNQFEQSSYGIRRHWTYEEAEAVLAQQSEDTELPNGDAESGG